MRIDVLEPPRTYVHTLLSLISCVLRGFDEICGVLCNRDFTARAEPVPKEWPREGIENT